MLNNLLSNCIVFQICLIQKIKILHIKKIGRRKAGCFWILFFVPLVAAKDSGFAKFYANQGLILFITGIILSVAGGILSHVPFVGFILQLLVGLVSLGMFVFLLVNAANGKAKELPIVGGVFTAFK